MAASSKAGCYAVLASLSGRYPPLEGRSPTCYSPVCHSTHGLLHFRVRLACVRHAASVDSEPGSNSHVKFVARRLARFRELAQGQLINARPIGSALFNPLLVSSSPPAAFVRTDNSGRPILRCDALTLCLTSLAGRSTGCVCLHALSSFQRTDRLCA